LDTHEESLARLLGCVQFQAYFLDLNSPARLELLEKMICDLLASGAPSTYECARCEHRLVCAAQHRLESLEPVCPVLELRMWIETHNDDPEARVIE
jgi:hypothetical protein